MTLAELSVDATYGAGGIGRGALISWVLGYGPSLALVAFLLLGGLVALNHQLHIVRAPREMGDILIEIPRGKVE